MQRIIYLDMEIGYKYADIKNQQELSKKQLEIEKRGYYVVCVLDLASETVIQKCDSFSAHAGFIKNCYPNTILD